MNGDAPTPDAYPPVNARNPARAPRDTERTGATRIRVNATITAATVRLVDVDGTMLGVVDLADARRAAADRGLDLLEIAPQARPPVCRIADYAKWCYQQDKAKRHRRQPGNDSKEIQLGVRIGEGDLQTKLRAATGFLTDGKAVRIVVILKGRDVHHPELVDKLLGRVTDALNPHGRTNGETRREGRRITVTWQPVASRT